MIGSLHHKRLCICKGALTADFLFLLAVTVRIFLKLTSNSELCFRKGKWSPHYQCNCPSNALTSSIGARPSFSDCLISILFVKVERKVVEDLAQSL